MRYIIIFFFLFSFGAVSSQTYNFEYYSNDAIKSTFVYDISQNKEGELLLATSDGLFVFNGIDFINIFEDDSLQDKFVNTIFVDKDNKTWFSLYNGGFGYFKKKNITILNKEDYVASFSDDFQGGVVVQTNANLLHYNQEGKLKTQKQITFLQIEHIDSNEILYINTDNKLFYKKNQTKLIQDSVSLFATNNKDKIAYVSNNKIQIISSDLKKHISFDLSNYNIENINQLNFNGNLLTISSSNEGLFEFTFHANYESFTLKRISTNQGLSSNDIRCSFIDREGNLWMGTYGKGVLRLPKNRILSYKIFDSKNKELAISVNHVLYAQNKLYLGTSNGLKMVSKNNHKIVNVIDDLVVITLEKKDDILFIGTLNNGLLAFKDGKINKIQFSTLFQPETVGCIKVNNDIISIGTNSGLYEHNLKTNKTVHYSTSNGLAHNVIENFIIDNEGYYWIDSPNSPMYKFKKDEIIIFKDLLEFKSFNITDFATTNNQVWIATAGDGVFKYENEKFTHYSTDDGLYSNYIYFIEEIANNDLIIGHKNGVSIVNYVDSKVEIHNLGYIKEMNNLLANSSYLAGVNNIWVGCGRNTLLNLDIEKYKDEKFIPQLIVSDILLNGKSIESAKEIDLPYDDYFTSLKVNALYLSNPSSVEYRFFLEGFDKQWNTVSYDDNIIRYQSIKDGDYTFRIKLFIDKQDTGIESIMKIHISKPFWLSIWFYLILLLILIGLFSLTIFLIQRRNRIIKESLEKKVMDRTEMIHEKNVNLKNLSEEYLKEKENAQYITKELTDSINYASNIQKVIMRKKNYLEMAKNFKDFYVIFKPKDLVSGDFYWGHKIDNYIYVIAGDCTGHGVPGAMLSLLGISQLNRIVVDVIPTDLVLNKLRNKIISDLGQYSESSLKDGMDLALVRYNFKTKELQFSGAHNTALIVRDKNKPLVHPAVKVLKEENGLILYSIAPNKQPVSMYMKMEDFVAHTVQLIEGDQIFMSTDGYFDQFGGPRYKKFMKKRFYQLIIDNHDLSAEDQKELLWKTLLDWKGDTSQIDDITVLSFRV